MDPRHQVHEVRLDDLAEGPARQMGVPELQHPGQQDEPAAVGRDVPQLFQGLHRAPDSGPRQAGDLGRGGEREPATRRAERHQHGQAASQRLKIARPQLLLRGPRRVHSRDDPVTRRDRVGQCRFHLPRCLQQAGQSVITQTRGRVSAGVAGHGQRADRRSARVPHGHRDRHHAGLDELVVLGPPCGGVEQDQAGRAAVGGQQVAHPEGHRHRASPGEAADEADPVAVPHGQRNRLVQLVGEPLGVPVEGRAQTATRQVRLAQLHQARREQHVAFLGSYVAEPDERGHDPVDRRSGQAGGPHQVSRAHRPPGAGGQHAQDGQPAFQSARRFHPLSSFESSSP